MSLSAHVLTFYTPDAADTMVLAAGNAEALKAHAQRFAEEGHGITTPLNWGTNMSGDATAYLHEPADPDGTCDHGFYIERVRFYPEGEA